MAAQRPVSRLKQLQVVIACKEKGIGVRYRDTFDDHEGLQNFITHLRNKGATDIQTHQA